MIKYFKYFTLLFLIPLGHMACKPKVVIKHDGEKDRISFKSVFGISYTEVSRRLNNGLSFNSDGYQLEPSWQMKFVSDDSLALYSPAKKAFINFPIGRGYDSIFYVARSFFRVKKITPDSILLQLIQAKADSIDLRGSNVYMTFYADEFIRNVIRKETATLKAPSNKDTMFVKGLINVAERDISKAFFARLPATVKSNSILADVHRHIISGDVLYNYHADEDYMYPTYNIVLKRCKSNFYYSFSAIVDSHGKLHYEKPLIPTTSTFYISHSKAVLKDYLQKLLTVTPGSTLGLIHPSTLYFHVKGQSVKSVRKNYHGFISK
ncbi:MAG: hypothetical protein JKY70_06820 [Mucilaginibacter sp.]|nr:hypothetical protein [Mucilaginibacter sp.]